MSVMRPELIMKSIIPVVMAGIIAIYGLVVAVLIAGALDEPSKYSLYKWVFGKGFDLSSLTITNPPFPSLLLPGDSSIWEPVWLSVSLDSLPVSLLESSEMLVSVELPSSPVCSSAWSWSLSSPKCWVCTVWLSPSTCTRNKRLAYFQAVLHSSITTAPSRWERTGWQNQLVLCVAATVS